MIGPWSNPSSVIIFWFFSCIFSLCFHMWAGKQSICWPAPFLPSNEVPFYLISSHSPFSYPDFLLPLCYFLNPILITAVSQKGANLSQILCSIFSHLVLCLLGLLVCFILFNFLKLIKVLWFTIHLMMILHVQNNNITTINVVSTSLLWPLITPSLSVPIHKFGFVDYIVFVAFDSSCCYLAVYSMYERLFCICSFPSDWL